MAETPQGAAPEMSLQSDLEAMLVPFSELRAQFSWLKRPDGKIDQRFDPPTGTGTSQGAIDMLDMPTVFAERRLAETAWEHFINQEQLHKVATGPLQNWMHVASGSMEHYGLHFPSGSCAGTLSRVTMKTTAGYDIQARVLHIKTPAIGVEYVTVRHPHVRGYYQQVEVAALNEDDLSLLLLIEENRPKDDPSDSMLEQLRVMAIQAQRAGGVVDTSKSLFEELARRYKDTPELGPMVAECMHRIAGRSSIARTFTPEMAEASLRALLFEETNYGS